MLLPPGLTVPIVLCPTCGGEIDPEVGTCQRCGAKGGPRILRGTPNSVADPHVERFRTASLILSVIAILAVAVGGYRFLSSRRDPDHIPANLKLKKVDSGPDYAEYERSRDSVPPVSISETDQGTLRVDSVWSDTKTQFAYALTSYRNTTKHTFREIVEITCNAMSADNRVIGTNKRAFQIYRLGPISPGFKGAQEIPIDMRYAGRMDHMKCLISAAK